MNFDFTAEENRFRDSLRAWLDQNGPTLLGDGSTICRPGKALRARDALAQGAF